MRVVIFVLLVVLYSSCKEKVYLSTKYEKCVVMSIDPPKHVYLDLKMVSSGRVFRDAYVSKHCNDMCVSVGDTILTTFIRYKFGDSIYEEFDNLHDKICNCK